MANEDTNDELELEIVDDVPEEEKPRLKPEAAEKPASTDDDSDLENYSESVKKRISKLTFERREAERQSQEAARMQEEAINYTKQLLEENKRLRGSAEQNFGQAVSQGKARAESEIAAARSAYKAAYEAGDSDGLVAAQEKLNKAQLELHQFSNYRPAKQEETYVPPAPQPRQRTAPQTPQLNEQQKKWLADNEWFGKNEEMTGYAYGLHERLVKSGIDPNSQVYYDRIDESVRKRFAEEFEPVENEGASQTTNRAPVVAPATRSVKNTQKVRITPTQIALAKRLGLTPEQYAAQLLKESRNG